MAQYSPTPVPGCSSCGSPPQLPRTGFDAGAEAVFGGFLLVLWVVVAVIRRRWR